MSRILLSAYSCEPGKGSEPEVGWMWATELESAGHEVWVITREANREAIERETNIRRRPRLHFLYVELPQWLRRWKRGGRGVHWYYGLWQWRGYQAARKLIKTIRFDCVQHVTFVGLRAPSLMGMLGLPFVLGPVSGGENVPKALRAEMSRPARLREWIRDAANWMVRLDPIMRESFRRAERILIATPESLRLIPQAFRDKCTVQLGVGLSREYLGWLGPTTMGSGDKLRLLYAGRLLEWKGVDLAIHAVKALRDRGVAVKLTIAGAGPAQAGLKRLATELKAEPLLRWILWVPHNQLRELYDDHDILVFPSLRDSGGMVVLEALAHGLPVVCTDRGGPASIVNDRCGRVVPTENRTRTQVVDALTDTLHELSLDRILLKRLSRGARARAWEFDFGKVVAKIHPTTPQSLAGSRV